MRNPSGAIARSRSSGASSARGQHRPADVPWPGLLRGLLPVLVGLIAILAATGGPVAVAVAQGTPDVVESATPSPAASPAANGVATPIPQTGAGRKGTLARGFGGTSVTPAEQELADKYAPVAMLKKQLKPCDPSGEQYLPIAVDVSLNYPEVKLRRDAGEGEAEDPVIMT
ncbi:MAG: hypothetical protein ACTHMX_06825, partial [Thermomicrobiales bacterium]